ncbi:DUF6302 family protein [Streptomyces sp. NPDC046976]|uniref:DUF6302 family protein n=1 Tax=Streptomyces sp. NPDC046976 TaxID=3155258 RepID=UPI00340296B7
MTHHDIPAASDSSVPARAARERVLLAERLADPALLEQAVEIQLGPEDDGSTDTCLAVPVGGRRVAGQVTVMGWGQATQVMLALTGRPGFPDVRDFGFGAGIDEPRAIRWGLHIQSAEHRECAQMWGYHAAGVEAYVAERESEAVPVTPLPDLPTAPTVARLYDALLGGHDNYAEDRRIFTGLAWEEAEALATTAVINRLHPPAIVRYCAGRGITQYLDLGCGFPVTDATPHPLTYRYPTLHDLVAKEGVEDPRVVYVDHDIRIYKTAGIEIEADPQPEWVLGDIRYMGQLLSSSRMRRLLDWDRPIAVLLHDVLPWIPDDGEVTVSLAVLREQLPPGSVLSITHAADFDENPMSRFIKPLHAAGLAFSPRGARAIGGLFGNWPLESPGLVPPHRWCPEHPYAELPFHAAGALAGVAVKPETGRG